MASIPWVSNWIKLPFFRATAGVAAPNKTIDPASKLQFANRLKATKALQGFPQNSVTRTYLF